MTMDQGYDNQPDDDQKVDEAMLELGDFVYEMSDIDGYLTSTEAEFALKMENVELDIPVQLDIRVAPDGTVQIGGSPPLYYVETTVMPVFHQMKINIERNKVED
ncbi:hypothetical protein LVD17_23505 [Fulvivirga ulvae]|uniref:hypothetical protein n=1 Tax=Fulvivirga ulvae TaxID=2904245 RepID=UPI001F452ED2|nr:hypothetical protein [Fulvivirga ulvae]UII31262.1 hypothetical protein LVD17_23505 [Fulvivirga ulvae]